MDENDILRSLNEVIEQRKQVATQRAELLQKVAGEKRGLTADEQKKDDDFGADMAAKDVEIRSLKAQLEAVRTVPFTEERTEVTDEDGEKRDVSGGDFFDSDEYRGLWSDYLRGRISYRQVKDKVPDEFRDYFRAMGRDGATTGDPVVPRNFMRKLVEQIQQASELVPEFNTVMIDGDKEFAVETGIGAAAYRDPGDAYPSSDPALTNKTVDIFNASRLVKVDDELLQDSAIDLVAYLARKFGQSIAILLEDQAIGGTGNDAKGPGTILATGILDNESAAIGVIDFDDLIDTRGTPVRGARRGAKWAFSTATETALMKLKDDNSRPLWTPSYTEGEPGRILGTPYVISDSMAAIAAGNIPVIYGPFRRYVTNYIRRGMTIQRSNDSSFTTGQVDFRGQLRHDFVNELPSAFCTLTVKS